MLRSLLAVIGIVLIALPEIAAAREDDYFRQLREKCTKHTERLVVLLLEDNPPFSWVNTFDRNRIDVYGVGPMVLKQLLKEDGLDGAVVFVTAKSRADLEAKALYQKGLDATIGIQYTPKLDVHTQREFVKPSFLPNPIMAIFAKGREKNIEAIKDLYDLKGAYVEKDDLKKIFPSDLPLATVKTVREGLLRLRNGELDYLLMGYYLANMELKKFKVQDEFVISEKVLRSANPFITISENSPCRILRETLNERMKAITADKQKMGEILYKVYQDYEEQTKGMPHL